MKRIDNPCDRCGFNVASHDRHGDPLPQHSTERDCFRAVYEAAVGVQPGRHVLSHVSRDESAIVAELRKRVEQLEGDVHHLQARAILVADAAPQCPKCRGTVHQCTTGDAGCLHCDNDKCGGFIAPRGGHKP